MQRLTMIRHNRMLMPSIAEHTYTTFPALNGYPTKAPAKPNLQLGSPPEDDFELFNPSGNMAGPGSPDPFIKTEADDMHYNPNFVGSGNFDMSQPFNGNGININGVNPNDLQMSGSLMNNYGSQHMSGSYIMGNSNIGDDELLDLGNLDEQSGHQGGFHQFGHQNKMMQQHVPHGLPNGGSNGGPVSINTSTGMNQMYSHTPDGAPIQSPFVNDFNNFQHFQSLNPQRPGFPQRGSMQGTFDVNARNRSSMPGMERQISDSRSPMTPHTPAISGLHLGTPDSSSFSSQGMIANHQQAQRHQKSASGQWQQTPGSDSWIDSPGASPHSLTMQHRPMSDVLNSGKHQSLPANVANGKIPGGAMQTQEAKRRKRRESHNLVERRRRDNINERIQDLSRLVPSHRLEDEKVRKHISNNGPLSPSLATAGMSPPQATSLLAGGAGKRAAGNITQGLPIEDKEKGPNKGDILNGAVSWTRDLMWLLNLKLQQEEQLISTIESLGGQNPLSQDENERRMITEVQDAMTKNDPASFGYSRFNGSGLRVPKHTNIAGEAVAGGSLEPSASPSNPNGLPSHNWINQSYSDNDNMVFKEEDEYGMDMGS